MGGWSTGTVHLKYTGGKLLSYLKTGALKAHGLISKATSGKVYNRDGKEVKLSYIPVRGDMIVLKG